MNTDFNVVLQYNVKMDYLDIWAGYSNSGFDGAVEKVVRRDNVTVGLRRDGCAIYVLIRNAGETSDSPKPLSEALQWYRSGAAEISEDMRREISRVCLWIMQRMSPFHADELPLYTKPAPLQRHEPNA